MTLNELMKNIAIVLTAAVLALAPVHASPVQLRGGDFVAFVGGTDLLWMRKDGRLEAALTARFLVAQPKFRDLAWEGATVEVQSTVHERWRRDAFGGWRDQLKRVGATVVIAQFGKMESLAGTLAGFVERYGTLLDELGGDGRRVVLLEPHGFEWETRGGNCLPDDTAAIRQLAEKRGLPFVSLAEMKALEESAPVELAAAVWEKHRLWYDYRRPANWKCLLGDDGERIFSNPAEGLPSFKQEWETFPGLIAVAEAMVLRGELPIPAPTPSREGSAEADIAKELATFEMLEGYEVNLFAEESTGVANPLSVRWDADGWMFVACPDGEPWFCQGDGIESRVETPHGISSLFQAGVFRLRPKILQLDPLLDDFMGPGNPWGVVFDEFGQRFVVDGAGGVSYLTPGSIPVKRRLSLPMIGEPGGYCGIEVFDDASFAVGDYKKNQVTRFRMPDDGGGFKAEFIEPLLRSKHRNFRPIDVKPGPDGAIHVVDWYNPITCHQDDFYRHPQRDQTHGRIWRVAKKGDAAIQVPVLTDATNDALFEAELSVAARAGDPVKRKAIYHSASMGCAAFHRIGDSGGIIGPDLSAVGSGVSAERIVTEVLWPARQVKDGFSLTRLTLKDGGVVQGYPQVSRDEKRLLLRDFATGHIQEIPAGEIVGREEYSCKRGVRLMIDENGKTSRTVIEDPFVPADIHERDWNHLRVAAKSRNFTFSINGKLASEFTHNAKAGRFDSGGIARQIHDKGMSVEFKDIRLKKLEMEPQPDHLK